MDVTLMGSVVKNVTVERAKYRDGSLALVLWEPEGLLATATVYLKHEKPDEGCVWIKDWSENDGMLLSLTQAGVIQPTGRVVQAGFTHAHEARVLSCPECGECDRVMTDCEHLAWECHTTIVLDGAGEPDVRVCRTDFASLYHDDTDI